MRHDRLCRCRSCKPGNLADAKALARLKISLMGAAVALLLTIIGRGIA